MAPRRNAPSPNSLSPQDSAAQLSSQQSPAFLGLPRSTSPSTGLTQFLSKPSKWFNRSASASKIVTSTSEPRSSTSSGRKHKISRPTDPRPILDTYGGGASRSVLDLSSSRHPGSLDIPNQPVPPSPSTPTTSSGGLGDLRTMSRRAWSRSADDLGKMSPSNLSPINTTFQDKVAQYRNRSDSSASGVSPSTPSSPASFNGRQPFPTMKSSVSVSPPRTSTLPIPAPPLLASKSADGSTAGNHSIPHVHTRSHSFTPKLSSKLAAPRFGPPSPVRKGSGASEREFPVKDLDKSTTINAPFPNSSQADVLQPVRNTTLLAPPLIIEPDADVPEADVVTDTKRSSQIVYHSGFINRLTETNANFFRHPPDLSSDRGWKPFKLELKGSKLYFYKPPGDRAPGIKALFPTQVDGTELEEEDGDEAETGAQRFGGDRRGFRDGGDGSSGRKKRAYWGRTKHPELILDGTGTVMKGSSEALIHEIVFATSFCLAPSSEGTQDTSEENKVAPNALELWKDFSTAVILWLPALVDRAKFEAEFTRCCTRLLDGSKDYERVTWLAQEYLRSHGPPADTTAWDNWRADAIPDANLVLPNSNSFGDNATSSRLATSSSTRAIFAPSPLLTEDSPNLGAFSPRPDAGSSKMGSIMDTLAADVSTRPGSAPSSPSTKFVPEQSPRAIPIRRHSSKLPIQALRLEGLSHSVLFTIDPRLLAQSLTLFHRQILSELPEEFVVEDIIPGGGVIETLFGSNDKPHWLTKLILLQILGPDHSSTGSPLLQPFISSSPGRTSSDGNGSPSLSASMNGPTSRTHMRSEVISVWVRIGELCRTAGDECTWRAIADALRSRPVARLEKVWKRVDPLALAAVETWVYPDAQDEWVGITEPRTTPWGGTAKEKIEKALEDAKEAGADGEEVFKLDHLCRARQAYEKLRTSFELSPRQVGAGIALVGGNSSEEEGIDEDISWMVEFWRSMFVQKGGSGGLASKFQKVDQFMSLSLAAEPRRAGLFEPYYWTRPPPNYSPTTALIPLTFPEPLPSLSLIDRSTLWRGRLDSDPSDLQYIRMEDRRGRINSGGWDFAGIKRGGTVIPVFGGELVLVVRPGADPSSSLGSRPPSQAPSRPPSSVMDVSTVEKSVSRAPSIRVKPGSSQSLDRKASVARRNSLPALSQKQDILTVSETSKEPPLRVLVQAATLNALVQILVHGLKNVSVSVADDNGEMSLREGKPRELFMDYVEFSLVWWRVFRSFVSPLVFFELLRKLYVSFHPQNPDDPQEFFLPIRKRSEVVQAMKEWLINGGGAQDLLDDPQLYTTLKAFLESQADHTMAGITGCDSQDVMTAWSTLQQEKEGLRQTFVLQAMRPRSSQAVPNPPRPRSSATRASTSREPPDLDQVTAEDLVDSINGMASAAFSNVTEEDLFATVDLLEVQTADRIGWYSQRDLPASDETVEIQNMYSHIQEVHPSSMVSESEDSFYRLLPPGVRSCIRAYNIIRKWLVSKIVAPRLGLRARQDRIELLLQTIEVARHRSFCPPASSHLPPAERPCTRSFVEAVVTSALLSIESRVHHRVWQNIGLQRGCQCDSLSVLLASSTVEAPSTRRSLTVDIGWLLERMLEIITSPDVLDSNPIPGNLLVNYDKRRHLCNLIADAPTSTVARSSANHDEALRRSFERLNNIERDAANFHFDYRAIKEEAQREAAQMPAPGSVPAKRLSRPFQRLVTMQIDKSRRDKTLRSRLQKEKALEQAKNDKREDMLTKAMRPRKPPPSSSAPKQHRNKKSMSAFLQFMRPISSAFGADVQPTSLIKKSPIELDFAPSGKPSLAISLVETRTAQYINQSRPFTFQLDTEDGGHYLLQAMTRQDMNKWIEVINRVSKMAAKRRLTYLGSSPKPKPSDHIHEQPKGSVDPAAVFGVDLDALLRRENGDEVPPGTIPKVLEQCLHVIESRGLTEVGICESPIRPDTDIHAVCDLVKTWFRLMPEPVFPSSAYHDIIEGMKLEDLDARLNKIREVVQGLPPSNFDLLRRVAEHLDKVTDFEESNQMTAEALAIVFSPNLLRAPHNDFVMILANMGQTHKLVKALITHFHTIFDEVDPEADAEGDQEVEYDSPIMEEDEEDESNDDRGSFLADRTYESESSALSTRNGL